MAVWNDIGSAIQAIHAGVSGAPTSVVRKADIVHPRETLPLTVISFGDETYEEWAALGAGGTDRGTVGKSYAFVIAYYREIQGSLDTTQNTIPDFFQALQRALDTGTLSGATTVWSTRIETNAAWENEPFRDGAEVSRFLIYVGSSEPRNG